MKTIFLCLFACLMVSCATFEQTPEDVQKKLSEPTRGRLYERDPLQPY